MDAFSKKKVTAKSSKTVAKSSDSSTDGAASKKPAPAAKTKKPAKRKPLATSVSSGSESDFGQPVKKSTAVKKSKMIDESFSMEIGSDEDLSAPRERAGRTRKPIQYLEDSDDDIF